MISLKKLWRDKRGNALVIAGAALPLVIGSAGLASDTIQWALWKRQLQRAADSGALAGVYDRVQLNGATSNTTTAINTDLDKNKNFWRPGKATSKLGHVLLGEPTISYPTGTNWTMGVRVQISMQKRLAFSSLFLSSPPTISAAATAATVRTGVYCVVSLVDTGETGIKASGTADVNLGCGMITNSTSLTAAIATGTSKVTASPIAAVGDIKPSTNWGDAELLPRTIKQDDPYSAVEPNSSMCTSPQKLEIDWNKAMPALPAAGATTCYSNININGPVTLASGTYVIDAGNLEFGPKANVTCNGCTFVLTNADTANPNANIGGITINSDAQLNMKAPTSGPYDGILIYQDRRAKLGATQTINGNSNSVLEGALYFPRQELQINGTAGITFKCAQFVSYIVNFIGTGAINNTCSDYGDDSIMGRHVRLVA